MEASTMTEKSVVSLPATPLSARAHASEGDGDADRRGGPSEPAIHRLTEDRQREPMIAIWATMATFLILLALLAWRLGGGQDPALAGHKAASRQPRQVLVRRIYERLVVVHLPPSAPARPASSSRQLSAAPVASAYAPVTRAS
jgi:hypothetical protein